MEMIEKARIFAVASHSAVKQVRKYTGEPYWVHLAEVADIVSKRPHSVDMIAAAWLHDVVEDTGVPLEVIWGEFGSVVASYVHWLTDRSKAEDGNRERRKEIDREYIRNAPAEVKTIKLADIISNTTSIAAHDKKFAKVYFREKALMLEVLKEGDQILWEIAANIVK